MLYGKLTWNVRKKPWSVCTRRAPLWASLLYYAKQTQTFFSYAHSPSSAALPHNEMSRDLIEIYCTPDSEFETFARLVSVVSLFHAENGRRCENKHDCQSRDGGTCVIWQQRRLGTSNRRHRVVKLYCNESSSRRYFDCYNLRFAFFLIFFSAREKWEKLSFFNRNSPRLLRFSSFFFSEYSPEWM